MQQYIRPEILATYTEEELVEEAAVCSHYPVPINPPPPGGGGTPS